MKILFLIILLSIVCILIPPLNVLSREFILFCQIIAMVLGIWAGWNLKKFFNNGGMYILYLYLSIPLLIILFWSYFFLKCNVLSGIAFYIISIPPSLIFGIGYGFYFKIFFKKNIFFILFNLLILLSFTYFLKIIDFLTFIFGNFLDRREGYFPTRIFLIGRIYFFIFSFFIFFLIKRLKKTNLFNFIIFTFLYFFFYLFWQNFLYGEKLYKIYLNKKIETDYWKIYCPKGHYLPSKIIRNLEWYGYYVRDTLNMKDFKKVNLFLFPDMQTFANLTDFHSGALGGEKGIYLICNLINSHIIIHELIHNIYFNLKPSKKLIIKRIWSEGLAVAIAENMHIFEEAHKEIAKMLKNGKLPPITKISKDPFFFFHSESLCYDISGSFVGFLIKEYGIEKFIKFQKCGSLKKVYGKELVELDLEWKKFLGRIKISEIEKFKEFTFYEIYDKPYLKCKCQQVGSYEIDFKEKHWYYDRTIDAFQNFKIYLNLSIEEPSIFRWKINLLYSLIGLKKFEIVENKAIKLLYIYNEDLWKKYEVYKVLFWNFIFKKDFGKAIDFMEKMALISSEDSLDNIRLMVLKNPKTSNYYLNSLLLPYNERLELLKKLKEIDNDFPAGHFYYFNFEKINFQEKYNSFKYFYEKMEGFKDFKINFAFKFAEELFNFQEYSILKEMIGLLSKDDEFKQKIYLLSKRLNFELNKFKKIEEIDLRNFPYLTIDNSYERIW